MKFKSNHRTEDGARVYSPLVLRMYDWWVLGFSNRYAWRCPTRSVLLPFFQKHLSENHLDVGVGTGYFLKNSMLPSKQRITLLDLNRNSLESACTKIAHLQPLLIQEDILNPRGALEQRTFDSISLFGLLHCLPGDMPAKAPVFEFLSRHLSTNGTLYGVSVLGDCVAHNWLGSRLMKLYNKKGIFGNQCDTLTELQSTLSRYFTKVTVTQHGKVALFTATSNAG